MAERDDFPWTHDQFQRYRALEKFLEIFYPERTITILDVGGVSPDREGRSTWLPLKRLLPEKSYVLDVRAAAGPGFVRGDGRRIPFRDGSFDVVASLDTLEHVPGNERAGFLRELSRVTRGSLFLSAPFRDPEIQRVEDVLFRQIKDRYGAEHEQLKEHGRHGLPGVEEVRAALGEDFPGVVDFSYGSLVRWLLLQTIENCYLFRRNSPAILGLLDKWAAARGGAAEFQPPFARHFWIASRTIGREELEQGLAAIRARLLEPPVEFGVAGAHLLNVEIGRYLGAERVAAVVVSAGDGRHLEECLNHLLTQKVDFEFEVMVWDIASDPAKRGRLRSRFPGVRYIESEPGESAPQALLKIAAGVNGDYVLLASDDILLPLDSAQKFFDALKAEPGIHLLSPRTVFKRYFSTAWDGKRRGMTRLLAGRFLRPLSRRVGRDIRWIFSECLFFRKEALYERVMGDRRLSRRNIFLWEIAGRVRRPEARRWMTYPSSVFKAK